MDYFFKSGLNRDFQDIFPDREEAVHVKALRLRESDRVCVVDGLGLSVICEINFISKGQILLKPLEYKQEEEQTIKTGLALAILDNRDRFEFALEKSIELGITDFYPLISKLTQKRTVNPERLLAKSISAIKQCHRTRLPVIHHPVTIEILLDSSYETFILCDMKGKLPKASHLEGSTLIFIGPEGGLIVDEIENISSDTRCRVWKLGENRLRAETAAIIATGMVNIFHGRNI